jgi:hypothetical protein
MVHGMRNVKIQNFCQDVAVATLSEFTDQQYISCAEIQFVSLKRLQGQSVTAVWEKSLLL